MSSSSSPFAWPPIDRGSSSAPDGGRSPGHHRISDPGTRHLGPKNDDRPPRPASGLSRPPSHFRDPSTRHPAGKFWLAARSAHEPGDSDHFFRIETASPGANFFICSAFAGIALLCAGGLADLFFGLPAVG
jgi:hypothetical protein